MILLLINNINTAPIITIQSFTPLHQLFFTDNFHLRCSSQIKYGASRFWFYQAPGYETLENQ